jgi:hypothetical protein
VGIGTTTPARRLHVRAGGVTTLANTNGALFTDASNAGVLLGSDNVLGYISGVTAAGTATVDLVLQPFGGNVMVGSTSTTAKLEVRKSDAVGQCVVAIDNPEAQGTGTRVSFRQNGGEQGSISNAYSGAWNLNVIAGGSGGVRLSGGATSWSSLSDERHKDVIEPIENGLTKVASLRAVIGKYKTDTEGTRRSFLIAQDVQEVLPEAVDANDPENLGLKYTEVIPLLVASIKELKAEVDALKARLTP